MAIIKWLTTVYNIFVIDSVNIWVVYNVINLGMDDR